jgi:hypothetical protein
MQRRESVHKAIRLPILTAVAVLLEDVEKPAVLLAMRLLQLEDPLEGVFIAFPEVAHNPLLSELEAVSEWIRVETSSAHWRKLPPISRNSHVDTSEGPLGAVGLACIRVTLARATEAAVEDSRDQAGQRADLVNDKPLRTLSPIEELVHA